MTPQETKAAVLAECERLCPNDNDRASLYIIGELCRIGDYRWDVSMEYQSIVIRGNARADADTWQIAFRLLNLKEPQEKDENGLLPCPFCGGKGDITPTKELNPYCDPEYYVQCTSCFSSSDGSSIKDHAKDNWNTRNGVTNQ